MLNTQSISQPYLPMRMKRYNVFRINKDERAFQRPRCKLRQVNRITMNCREIIQESVFSRTRRGALLAPINPSRKPCHGPWFPSSKPQGPDGQRLAKLAYQTMKKKRKRTKRDIMDSEKSIPFRTPFLLIVPAISFWSFCRYGWPRPKLF